MMHTEYKDLKLQRDCLNHNSQESEWIGFYQSACMSYQASTIIFFEE